MKITAIIAEYNPFTSGHAFHLGKARAETGADAVISVMSGSFTQRGDSAIADKYLRAATAVRCGVDMVFELPLIYTLSPAEHFAYGAVKMLSEIKEITHLSFGSECGDATLLEKAAELSVSEPEELSLSLKRRLERGTAYPKAYAEAVAEYAETHEEYKNVADIYDGANNVLGISYIAAAKKLGWEVAFHTVKRVGAGYDSTATDTEYPSAAAIREALLAGKLSDVEKNLPPASYELLRAYRGSQDALGDMILYKMKQADGHELLSYRGFNTKDGLNNRLKIAAETSSTYAEYLEKAKTKNYTMARIKRLSVGVLFDLKEEFFQNALTLPPYYHVLAIRKEKAAELLSTLSYLPNFMTKFSDAEKKVDKKLRPLVKLDWKAQGVLSVVNRDTQYNRVMLVVE